MEKVRQTTFAVIIPLHNKAAHIERALSSVFKQSRQPDEIIIVDDASTDDGPDFAVKLGGDRISLIRRTHPGPGGYAARNTGIAAATSEWIAFLDADDEWSENHLASIEAAILREASRSAIMVGTAFKEKYPRNIWRDDVVTQKAPSATHRRLNAEGFLRLWLRIGECPVWTSAIAAKRQALLDVGLFPESRCVRGGDKDLWLRLAMSGPVILEPTQTAVYYKDADNMVTLLRSANQRHCMCGSIPDLSEGQSAEVKALLSKLNDLEIYKYSLRTIKSERLASATWAGFNKRRSPIKAALLMAASSWIGHTVLSSAVRMVRR